MHVFAKRDLIFRVSIPMDVIEELARKDEYHPFLVHINFDNLQSPPRRLEADVLVGVLANQCIEMVVAFPRDLESLEEQEQVLCMGMAFYKLLQRALPEYAYILRHEFYDGGQVNEVFPLLSTAVKSLLSHESHETALTNLNKCVEKLLMLEKIWFHHRCSSAKGDAEQYIVNLHKHLLQFKDMLVSTMTEKTGTRSKRMSIALPCEQIVTEQLSMQRCRSRLQVYLQELVQVACHPSRLEQID